MRNSFILVLTLLIHDKIHIGAIKVVRTINRIEIPSIPNLNFISPLIQFLSSTNWKPVKFLSNEYQRKIDNKKFAILVNNETYIALLIELVLLWLKKINKAPNNGKKIIYDKIGKFIIILILSKLLMLIIQLTSRMHNHK